MKTLKQMPIPVAILIMVLCIVIGVAFGNHNALSRAMAEPEEILTEVSALASQRGTRGKNLVVVAKRNDVDSKNIKALEDAISQLAGARKANKIASANESLTFAATVVNEQIQLSADESDRRLATGVMDDLSSDNNILTRRARVYNDSLEDAAKVYRKLPFGWLVGGMPEVYQ